MRAKSRNRSKGFLSSMRHPRFRHKMTVKRGVVRDERGVAHETRELLARLNGRGRIGDISIKDIRKMKFHRE